MGSFSEPSIWNRCAPFQLISAGLRTYKACYPALNSSSYSGEVGAGLSDGGPYYDIGEGIAQAILTHDHVQGLIQTVKEGPIDFFSRYDRLTRRQSELPKLPPDVAAKVDELGKSRRR